MSEQDISQATGQQSSTHTDSAHRRSSRRGPRRSWQPEPEPTIDEERQKYLNERYDAHSIYIPINQAPFKDISLSRADVKWLLAKQENVNNGLNVNEGLWFMQIPLDLRGTDLSQLPL